MPGNSKGNPASHRMTNTNLKARRERSWARGQARKRTRRSEQELRAQANAVRRNRGTLEHREACAFREGEDNPGYWLTPHEYQVASRRRRRDALRAKGLLPPIGTTRRLWEKTRMMQRDAS